MRLQITSDASKANNHRIHLFADTVLVQRQKQRNHGFT